MTIRRVGLLTVLLALVGLAGVSPFAQAPAQGAASTQAPAPGPAPATPQRPVPAIAAPAATARPTPAPATATATMPVPPLPIGTPPEELPRFEVASVKKHSGGSTAMGLRSPGGGRVTVVNLPLRLLLTQAFGIRDTQVIGGPSWMTSDRFTITAKAETNAPRDQLMLMLRAVLIDRFGLTFHVEQREAQSYVLTAPPGWKPNDRIQAVDCTAGGRGAAPPAAGAAPPAAGAARPAVVPCGNLSLSNNVITARGLTFASFASLLGSLGGLGQVQDRTDIPGTFNFQVEAGMLLGRMTSALSTVSGGGSPVITGATADLLPTLPEGPSLNDAVKGLGLELVRRNESIDVLVIDSVNQPDED